MAKVIKVTKTSLLDFREQIVGVKRSWTSLVNLRPFRHVAWLVFWPGQDATNTVIMIIAGFANETAKNGQAGEFIGERLKRPVRAGRALDFVARHWFRRGPQQIDTKLPRKHLQIFRRFQLRAVSRG